MTQVAGQRYMRRDGGPGHAPFPCLAWGRRLAMRAHRAETSSAAAPRVARRVTTPQRLGKWRPASFPASRARKWTARHPQRTDTHRLLPRPKSVLS